MIKPLTPKLLMECIVRTGNSMVPLLQASNGLGLDGHVVTGMKVVHGGDEAGDIMHVELYGIERSNDHLA